MLSDGDRLQAGGIGRQPADEPVIVGDQHQCQRRRNPGQRCPDADRGDHLPMVDGGIGETQQPVCQKQPTERQSNGDLDDQCRQDVGVQETVKEECPGHQHRHGDRCPSGVRHRDADEQPDDAQHDAAARQIDDDHVGDLSHVGERRRQRPRIPDELRGFGADELIP